MQTSKKSDRPNPETSRLQLLPLVNSVSAAQVLEVSSAQRIYACDFAITGAENFLEKPWGYETGRLVNIDHHAPTPRMRDRISSTNLAIVHVQERGIARPDETVVINHTDCDSILSCAIQAKQTALPTCCKLSTKGVITITRYATCACY